MFCEYFLFTLFLHVEVITKTFSIDNSHQARFQQPYRVILPQSMQGHAQYLHYLNSMQPREPGPIMEQTTLPGHVSAEEARVLQLQLQQQQQLQLQQQLQQEQAKLLQQQQLQEQQAAASKKAETPQVCLFFYTGPSWLYATC